MMLVSGTILRDVPLRHDRMVPLGPPRRWRMGVENGDCRGGDGDFPRRVRHVQVDDLMAEVLV
jgi:hypothetical protein